MEGIYYTLQDFFTHSKSVTYVMMGLVLVAYVAIWNFIVSREEDKFSGEGWEMHEH